MSEDKQQFKYSVDLTTMVSDGKGGQMLRYGRMRVRDEQFRHLGQNAPLREDGALYDVLDPLRRVMPLNVEIQKGKVDVSPLGIVRVHADKVIRHPIPEMDTHRA